MREDDSNVAIDLAIVRRGSYRSQITAHCLSSVACAKLRISKVIVGTRVPRCKTDRLCEWPDRGARVASVLEVEAMVVEELGVLGVGHHVSGRAKQQRGAVGNEGRRDVEGGGTFERTPRSEQLVRARV